LVSRTPGYARSTARAEARRLDGSPSTWCCDLLAGQTFEVAKTVYRADRYLFRGTLVTDSEGTAPVIRETR
jgi:hypothetical protein